jgi:hypothetical protein
MLRDPARHFFGDCQYIRSIGRVADSRREIKRKQAESQEPLTAKLPEVAKKIRAKKSV